jgi:hypothetical protein
VLAGELNLVLGSAVDTWATVAVAVGTLAAVLYALFRDLVVAPRRRPKLELRFDRTRHDQVIVESAAGGEAASVRLRVANRPGADTADEVVVVVTEVRSLADSTTRPVGLPVAWSGTRPPLTVAAVHPGSERHVDLPHVDLPVGDEAPLVLDLTPKPAGAHGLLRPSTHEVSVEIRARNADAACYVVPISWDGSWSGNAAMWDHLRVETPQKLVR